MWIRKIDFAEQAIRFKKLFLYLKLLHLTIRVACVAAALASRGKATRMVSCVQTPTPPLRRRGGVGVCLQATRMAGSPPNSHTQKQLRQLRRLLWERWHLSNHVVSPGLSKDVKLNISGLNFPLHPGNGQITHFPGTSDGPMPWVCPRRRGGWFVEVSNWSAQKSTESPVSSVLVIERIKPLRKRTLEKFFWNEFRNKVLRKFASAREAHDNQNNVSSLG